MIVPYCSFSNEAMLSASPFEAASAAGAIEKLAEAAGEEISPAGSSPGSTGVSMISETKEREHPNNCESLSCHGSLDKTIQELIFSSAVPAMLKRLVAPDHNNDAEAGRAKRQIAKISV